MAGIDMTAADLERHRIGELERITTEQAGIIRALERDVDRLKLEGAAVISAVAKLEGRLEERDSHLQISLARLHERLDERLKAVAPLDTVDALRAQLSALMGDELREQGAKDERRRLWKAWIQIVGATVAVLGLLVTAAALFLP